MTLVHAHGVSFRHAHQPDALFAPLTFTLAPGDHVALIGPNGAGKSTLLALMAGDLQPTEGSLSIFGTVARMPQQVTATADTTVLDMALGGDPALDAIRHTLREAERTLDDPDAATRYAQALDRYGDLDGYGRELAAQSVLRGLGLPDGHHDAPVLTLSSGQRSRVSLARLLLTPADLYLFDEPSNHLDPAGQRWLATHLESLSSAFVLVTHDRLLLRHGIDRVFGLRRGHLITHHGTYADFQQAVATADAQAMQHYEAEQRRAKAADAAATKRMALARNVERTPPGQGIRSGKPFYQAMAGRIARTARLLRERADDARRLDKPYVETGIGHLSFRHTTIADGIALSARNLTCGYEGHPVLSDVDLDLHHGDRLAIAGRNGVGKTTLLKTLTGLLPPLSGEVIRGQGTRMAVQHQDGPIDGDDTPLAMGLQLCSDAAWVRTVLACLKLGPEHIQRPLRQLSPGEQGKAELARMLLSGANLLVLDEPTNHLDLMTREALEAVLNAFPGTILLVSHDAVFVEAVADAVLAL